MVDKKTTVVTVIMLSKVDNKTTCAAYSGRFPYSKAKSALFLDVGKELAINKACAVVPSNFNVKIMMIATAGERIKRPNKLRNSGKEKRLSFIYALCAPSVISAMAKKLITCSYQT
jgi:hypothetical protein